MSEKPTEKFALKSESATPQPALPVSPAMAGPRQVEIARQARPERRKKDSARLVWDSKPKRPPSPRDIEFQTAEIVIPNPARDADSLPFTAGGEIVVGREIDRLKMNRLIWGDNLLAMQALLAQGYEGKIDLIYIDPPFDSKADYSHELHFDNVDVTKEPSVLERLAYRDTWEAGTDSYMDMLYPRIQLMKRLLSERGSIFVHCDYHVSHLIRFVLEEAFGRDRLLNEIIWRRKGGRRLVLCRGCRLRATRFFGSARLIAIPSYRSTRQRQPNTSKQCFAIRTPMVGASC
jgi:hypothetical protein